MTCKTSVSALRKTSNLRWLESVPYVYWEIRRHDQIRRWLEQTLRQSTFLASGNRRGDIGLTYQTYPKSVQCLA